VIVKKNRKFTRAAIKKLEQAKIRTLRSTSTSW